MPLDVLQGTSGRSDADLLRLFHRTELLLCRHLGDEAVLDEGAAITSPHLASLPAGNGLLEARDYTAAVDDHFRMSGGRCLRVLPNPGLSADAAAALAARLAEAGFTRNAQPVYALAPVRLMAAPPADPSPFTVIPARASYRHCRELLAETGASANEIQAMMLHLEDPHFDALLALSGTTAAGLVATQGSGDAGCISHLIIHPRHPQAGALLLSRALEMCARSVYGVVLAGVARAELLQSAGFRKVGESVGFERQ